MAVRCLTPAVNQKYQQAQKLFITYIPNSEVFRPDKEYIHTLMEAKHDPMITLAHSLMREGEETNKYNIKAEINTYVEIGQHCPCSNPTKNGNFSK